MKPLFDAILTKFNASADLKAAGKSLWRENVPEKTAYPFIVVQSAGGRQIDTFGETIEELYIRFVILTQGPSDDTADTIAGHLMAAFDWTALTVAGYTFIACERTSNQSGYDPEEDVWQYTIQYTITLQKS